MTAWPSSSPPPSLSSSMVQSGPSNMETIDADYSANVLPLDPSQFVEEMGRAPCCEKVGLKRGRWTVAEDEILLDYIAANGEGSWRSLPKNAGLLRCGKSCRLRWINYLRSDLKRGNFTEEEEEIIIKLQNSLGNRWSQISGHLPGRTDNEIKNYWNSHILKKIQAVDHQRAGTGGRTASRTPRLKNQKKKRAKATAPAKAATEPAENGAAAAVRSYPSVASSTDGGTVDGEIINETDQDFDVAGMCSSEERGGRSSDAVMGEQEVPSSDIDLEEMVAELWDEAGDQMWSLSFEEDYYYSELGMLNDCAYQEDPLLDQSWFF